MSQNKYLTTKQQHDTVLHIPLERVNTMTIIARIRTESDIDTGLFVRTFDTMKEAETFSDNALGKWTESGQVKLISLFDSESGNSSEWELEQGF